MIQSALYNGINFSGDFARTNELINFSAKRVKNKINRGIDIEYLSFVYLGLEPELIGIGYYYPDHDVIELDLKMFYFELYFY